MFSKMFSVRQKLTYITCCATRVLSLRDIKILNIFAKVEMTADHDISRDYIVNDGIHALAKPILLRVKNITCRSHYHIFV